MSYSADSVPIKYKGILHKLDVIERMASEDDPDIFKQIENLRVHIVCLAAQELGTYQ